MTKTALITGGQQGIGLAVASALYEAGWEIAVAAEVAEDAPSVQNVRDSLPGARYLRHDISDLAAVPALLDAAGPITTLVSNAGVGAMSRGDLLDVSVESFDRCNNINLRGAFFLIQECARRMISEPKTDYRSIHVISSVSADVMSVDRAEYCISKSGAACMAQAFAVRLAPENIGVFDIRPGIIKTPMTQPVSERYDTRIANGLVPAKRWGTPEDIGQTILPLARGEMAFATGSVIPVDGGLSIHRM